jgi:hypothetical protein
MFGTIANFTVSTDTKSKYQKVEMSFIIPSIQPANPPSRELCMLSPYVSYKPALPSAPKTDPREYL